jgi:hypothetical protein
MSGMLRSSCCLIFGLLCGFVPAGPDGIRRKSPHLLNVHEGQIFTRLSLPRSDLLRHQSNISLRNFFC